MKSAYVIGSGPNGLTAAITLAKAGLRTTVLEAEPTVGGGTRSAELTLPGFVHDICSAIHPMAASSPVFRSFPLAEHGLQWIHPDFPAAHPLDGGRAGVQERSIDATVARLGPDGPAWERTFRPLSENWDAFFGSMMSLLSVPKHPLLLARFGLLAPLPSGAVARSLFQTEEARALFAGMAAHSVLPLDQAGSSAFALMLTLAGHAVGWPMARGGSQKIADALASYFESLGGKIFVNAKVRSLDEVRGASLVLCDISPKQLVDIAGGRLPEHFSRKLMSFRYGPGVFKMDWALNGPIPWTNPDCRRAGTVHVGGDLAEITASEKAPWENRASERPFVLLAQQSLFDPTRAPAGKHTAWGYCHVPNGSNVDMTAAIEDQVERFAPGFRSLILARAVAGPAAMESHNANLVGGDITGGAQDLKQLLLRPTARFYGTPLRGLYLCSASTPPGGGVHGMCGYNAARMALKSL